MSTSTARHPAQTERFVLELYIVGDSPRSATALANLEMLRKKHLPNAQVEVIDIWEHPRRILLDSVFVTPMLVKVAPGPTCRIVGDLSNEARVLQALGLRAD